ncbi:hypothetical protein [Enterococcus alishanensis]
MRYTTEISFVLPAADDYYDPELGEYVEGEPDITNTLANVTDLGTNRSVTIFGDIKQGAKVIRTQPLFLVPEKWRYIQVGNKNYQLTTARCPLERNSLIVEEVILNESAP